MTSSADSALAIARHVCDALDPVLTPHGFQAGQAGIGRDVEVTFCSAGHEFSARFPHLAYWMDLSHPAACVDLTLHAHPQPARLSRVWLEGRELDDVVRDGRYAVGPVDGVGLPLEAGLDRLARTLTVLLLQGSPHE
ncbi:hypothetical protein M3148_14245 [Georgenia satyanarayanai]|uniref:hypothetical protein n=1 Tax=Georgenia satyanarayanai TaxID=860221 RepID=UPI0020409DFC|nr:hypothetical protein [Georgenia satyanarayanai]MCM3662141.1 hypothetical protein [Georgenia satyanarayanai]